MNTTTRWETKLWDSPNFARLSDQLIDQYDAQIIFTGQKHDSPSIDEIMSLMRGQVVNASGKTTIKELAYLLQCAAPCDYHRFGSHAHCRCNGNPCCCSLWTDSPVENGTLFKKCGNCKESIVLQPLL